MDASKFRLLFFGSDRFSIRVLKHILRLDLRCLQVMTKHNSLLSRFSAQNRIETHIWPADLNQISPGTFDIGLVASFGHLIDESTVNLFDKGLFNVHPSLLPRYRGSTPVQAAILDGLSETGCSIMKIPPIAKFDIGDIILQEQLAIRRREYAHELRDRLADLGGVMSERLLLNYQECLLSAKPQTDEKKSYARKLKPEQGLLQFRSEDSQLIDRKVRAYTGFIELFTYCLGGLKVWLDNMRDPSEVKQYGINRLLGAPECGSVTAGAIGNPSAPGTMHFHKLRQALCIKCSDDSWVAFESVTPEFKPRMKALDFYNGYMSKVDKSHLITDI